MKLPILLAILAPAAFGQFALYRVDGGVERAVPAVYDMGQAYPEETLTARFRLRNVSDLGAPLVPLAVKGTGFSLTGPAELPAGLASQQAVEFTVTFQATAAASYSAVLDAEGVAAILTAAVLPNLTYRSGGATLPTAGLDFGIAETGGSVSRRITIANLTALTLAVPPISVRGEAFPPLALSPAGAVLQPSESAQFDLLFQPPGVGSWTGTLTIGDRSYPLGGSATGPAAPRPILTVDLPESRSGRQGSISIRLDAPAKAAAAGALTLEFQPAIAGAADPAIQFGPGGRSLPFTIAPGDTGVHFGELAAVPFQTGTTAGTIAIAVELGGVTERNTITIPPAAVAIAAAQGTRTSGAIELRVSGFDNTRTAGAIVYTFYDASGAAVAAIPVDNTAEFAAFFAGSDTGGEFVLRAVFPVSGDASKIAAFEVAMKNTAGTAASGRVKL